MTGHFNPRSPRGGATAAAPRPSAELQDFNPRSPRGGATSSRVPPHKSAMISIHAPHEGERRRVESITACTSSYFNPRSPRGGATEYGVAKSGYWEFQSTLPTRGSDASPVDAYCSIDIFQSTLPTRGSDGNRCTGGAGKQDFNPRSPRGGATAEKCICIQHFREFTEYYPLRHGDARCIAPQDCIIQAFFGAKKRCFYVRLCFALKNKGVRG